MRSKSGNMKGFYRVKKPKTSKKSSKKSPDGGKADLKEEYDENEKLLRQFDLTMEYGPCMGMTRLARWELAQRFNLNPPPEIERLLKSGKVKTECLWSKLSS